MSKELDELQDKIHSVMSYDEYPEFMKDQLQARLMRKGQSKPIRVYTLHKFQQEIIEDIEGKCDVTINEEIGFCKK